MTYPSVNSTQIKLDVPRTFSDEAHFSVSSKVGQEELEKIERVCLAYSVRNSVVGYCQGFNLIVGRLI